MMFAYMLAGGPAVLIKAMSLPLDGVV